MTDPRLLIREGRTAEALVAAKALHDRAPDDTDAKLVLGIAYALNEQAAAARPLLAAALNVLGEAGDMRHWRLLGQVCAHLGDTAGEVAALREAVRRAPGDALNWLRLSAGLIDLKQADAALEAAAASLTARDSADGRRLFVRALRDAGRIGPPAVALLPRALTEAWAPAEEIQRSLLRLHRSGATGLRLPLLLSGPIYSVSLEREHTALRRRLLAGEAADLALRAALAVQAFGSEYAWAVTPEEAAQVAALGDPATPEALLTLAAYRALGELPGIDRWLGDDQPEPVRQVVRQQVLEPRRERALAAGIEAITPIRDAVSQAVRAQYEENPYPRWIHQPAAPRLPAALAAPGARTDVLVVGCGTGQQAVLAAAQYPGAQVLGVDLSRASLGYAARKTQERGLDNVRYAQADLLELRGMTFDVIECVGVLHHLEDPFGGMAMLRPLLRAGGVMLLGVYSRTSRAALAPAQRLAQGYPRTAEGIRALRQAIMAAPDGDPVRAAMAFVDFYSLSMCRDLLMHTQEQTLSMAELQRLVDGFRVLRVVAPDDVREAYRAAYPDDPDGVDLDNWDAFEQRRPESFRSMYQLWLQKLD